MLLFSNWHFCGLKKKHYSCFVEIWKNTFAKCGIDDFSWVCVAASLIEVYLCWGNEEEGRGRSFYPTVPCTSMEPHNTRCGTLWSPVKYHSVPHQYHLWPSTSCLWRWAPISTVAPKLLPMTHKFCHFNTPREHFYVNSQTSHKTQ